MTPTKGVEAQVQDGSQLTYSWTFDGHEVSTHKNCYLKVPQKAGTYQIRVTVSDDGRQAAAVTSIEVAPESNNKLPSTPFIISWNACDKGALDDKNTNAGSRAGTSNGHPRGGKGASSHGDTSHRRKACKG
ncbi:PKD domain-containing protein [Paraburkholderia sp. GAS333]|uniref:PKD domain-containing protein n=1 Tax=Paraburkholderia sp. GAS333 TaxID=3156279 RepID=UPI003D1E6544